MRKPRNIQPINREDKAKNSRNHGYVMKYPRIFNEISTDTQRIRQTEQRKQKVATRIFKPMKKFFQACDKKLSQ